MGYSKVLVMFFAVALVGVSSVQCFNMYRPPLQSDNCPSTVEEIKTLLNLARMLEGQEKPKPNPYDPEELIMKLVNALVVTSTQNRCDSNNNINNNNNGSGRNPASRGPRDGLVNLDLLNPNNPNNVAQLDLAKQTVAGVGIGDTTNGIVGGAIKDLS